MNSNLSRMTTPGLVLIMALGLLTVRPVAACHSNVHIIDVDTGSHLGGCGTPLRGEFLTRHRSGWFGDGDTAYWGRGTYRFTYARSCRGYLVDHWEVIGAVSNVIKSGNQVQFDLGRGNADVYLFLRKPRLTVRVDPPGSGDVGPYGKGTHRIDAGTRITLSPRPNAGWEFDHWSVDGERVASQSRYLRMVMNSDHEVVAHFRESVPAAREVISVASPAIRACRSHPQGWPFSSRYRGLYTDVAFNEDLLRNLSGMAHYWEGNNILLVGVLSINPQPWTRLGVFIDREEGVLSIEGEAHRSIEGKVDYGLIYLECDGNFTTWVAGVTRYGTRTALMWLLNHPNEVKGHLLVAVEWVDSNGDGAVRDSEIRVIHTLP